MKARHPRTTKVKHRKGPTAARRRGPSAADLKKQLDERTRERDEARKLHAEAARRLVEALEQQTATSEVLEVISSSPGELEPVFQAMLENATRICEAKFGTLQLCENGEFKVVGLYGAPPAYVEKRQREPIIRPMPRGLAQLARTKQIVHIAELGADGQDEGAIASLAGARTILIVPLLKDDELVGGFSIFRKEVEPFTDKQIELVSTFADQAVIAIENTRLLSELRQRTDDLSEALEQQRASAEVLNVVSNSVSEVKPVFEKIIESCERIFATSRVGLNLIGPDGLVHAGAYGPGADKLGRENFPHPVPGSATGAAISAGQPIQYPDALCGPDVPQYARRGAEIVGFRAFIMAPLLSEGRGLGAIFVGRETVGSFSDKEISLLKSFADQAVIAIENARLFNELRESLQQQTATADVLKVISRSTFDLQTVLNTLVESAARLCEADVATIAGQQDGVYRQVAQYGHTPEHQAYMATHPVPLGHGSVVGRTLLEGRVVQIPDILADPEYTFRGAAQISGVRTMLGVPMLREGIPIGVLNLQRTAVRPFTERQIELVTTFADQAVIAIENVRLFEAEQQRTRELSEALEQQTATSEVLKVISSSPGELEPVFQAMLKNATRICEAKFANLLLYEGDEFRVTAMYGAPPAWDELRRRDPVIRLSPNHPLARVVKTKQLHHFTDVRTEQGYIEREPAVVALAELAGARTVLVVPMLKENRLIGVVAIYRQEVCPFTDKQIELLMNFAAQAVIAIENTRLLNELRESLEQQTATSEVLSVISSSPGELEPVFNAMLENATRICEAQVGNLFLQEGDDFRAVAVHGESDYAEWYRREPVVRTLPGMPLYRVVKTKKVLHIHDLRQDQSYLDGNARIVSLVETAGARTHLMVPMLKESELVGAIVIYRQEVRPFTDKQIELVQNFAAQAVIAIENTRLLSELRQRTEDLSESLERQTATSEVLQVISRSPGGLEPVFEAMLRNSVRICEANFGQMFQCEDNAFRFMAQVGAPPSLVEWDKQRGRFQPSAGGTLERLVRSKQVVHIADISFEYASNPTARFGRARSYLAVPMLKENEVVGAIVIYRQEVRPFTSKHIELVKNFAAQAVIAIENTRLLNELRQRTDDLSVALEHQTATGEILSSISGSVTDAKPVFEAIVRNLRRLFGTRFATVQLLHDGMVHLAAAADEAEFETLTRQFPRPLDDTSGGGLAMLSKQVVQFAPALADPATPPTTRGFARSLGFDSVIFAPMMRDGEVIGAVGTARPASERFDDRQVALIKTFADQAVIAIENVRLFDEVQARTRELTQSVGELRALGEVTQAVNSTLDLQTVLDTIVAKATQLSGTEAGVIYVFDEASRQFELRATYGMTEDMIAVIRENHADFSEAVSMATQQRKPDQIADLRPTSRANELVVGLGYRARLVVPLLAPDQIVGALVIRRKAPGEFPQGTIELLQTFAAQSVLAILNARLFESVEVRTRELAKSLEDLRTAQDRLVQTEKLASLGQLTAGIAHEIKNPLNFVNNFSAVSVELIDELREALSSAHLDSKLRAEISEIADMLQGNLDKVVQHGKRADSIVKNMLLHSRHGSGEHRPVDINALVEESLNLAYHGARAEKQGFNITLETSFDPDAGEVDVFPQEITRVLLNLISNGFYAATKRKAEARDGGYEPTLAAATRNLGDRIEISIRDNGTGIPPEVKDKMFNPFFTTKPAGEGTGLGLSISHDIVVKQHGGSIEVDTQPGEFTEFRIVLPRGAATIAKLNRESALEPAHSRR